MITRPHPALIAEVATIVADTAPGALLAAALRTPDACAVTRCHNRTTRGLCTDHTNAIRAAIEEDVVDRDRFLGYPGVHTCKQIRCVGLIHARGLCRRHYLAARRAQAAKACTVTACPRHAVDSGMCDAHARRARRYGNAHTVPPRAPSPNAGTCSDPACDRDATRKGQCNTHYMRDYRAAQRTNA